MKRFAHIFLMVPAVFLLFLIATATSAPCAGLVKWYAYDEGMAMGKADEKKTLISFYADWCQYCRAMDQKTYKDPAIVSYLNDNFITIRVDVEREKQIAAQYNINPLPDTWFLSQKGEIIGNKPGFMTAEELLPVLQFIHTESYLKMSFAEFMEAFRGEVAD